MQKNRVRAQASRRSFLGAMTALSAASYGRVLGANDRVQLGFIGCGLVAAQHIYDFKNQKDADLVAACDVYQPRLEQGLASLGNPNAKGYGDFRRLLDNKLVQAVVISTPDHWHPLAAILACAAGKDVYVEKPIARFVQEGRWMVKAARKYNRVVQAGTQNRSGPHYQAARQILSSGQLGKIHSITLGHHRNIFPGFPDAPEGQPPSGLDYDMWLGPSPKRPYARSRVFYHFRWFWDYSGGQMTNLGAHDIDIAQWVMNVKGPSAVSSSGGRFCLTSGGDTPDTQDTIFEYPGFTLNYSIREACAGRRGGGLQFFGTKGSMSISRGGFDVLPETKVDPSNQVPGVISGWAKVSAHPAGGPQRTDVKSEPWMQPLKGTGSDLEQLDLHARNFLDCIKSRKRPNADIEDAHRTSTATLLANISVRLGRKLRWDAEKEEIIGDREASAMLVRPYRKPWEDILRSLNL